MYGGGENTTYTYDTQGNRLTKFRGGELPDDVYVRDASGNILAIYEKLFLFGTGVSHEYLKELDIYYSSRLGVIRTDRLVWSSQAGEAVNDIPLSSTRAGRSYKLTNHLSNVLTTTSDLKLGIDSDMDEVVDYYWSDPRSASDYYPFGMNMPARRSTCNYKRQIFLVPGKQDRLQWYCACVGGEGRSMSSGSHRFGFNGKERDPSISSLTHGVYPDVGRGLRALMKHRGLDRVRFHDKGRVKNSYFEIFDNVSIHANTMSRLSLWAVVKGIFNFFNYCHKNA